MKRTRQINPGFFTNDELAEITPLGRLLFAGLWVIADREGRLEDRPKKIKAEILPYDDCDIDDLLNQLAKAGFIERYKVDIPRTDQGSTKDTPRADVGIIQVVNFAKYQHPHRNESASTLPPPNAETQAESGSADMDNQGHTKDIPRTDQGSTKDTPRMPSSLYLVSSNSEINNNSLTSINNKQTGNEKEVNQKNHTLAEIENDECMKYYQNRIHPFTGVVEREFVATLIQDYGAKMFKQGVDVTANNASYKGAKIWRYLAAVLKGLKEKPPDKAAAGNAFDNVLDEIIGGDDGG